MKFIVNSTTLLKSLQAISGVISSNNTMPILDDFLFDLHSDHLEVTSSDLETTMSVSIPLEKSEEVGAIAVPAKILMDTLKTFSDIPITFKADPQSLGIEIEAGEGKFKLSGHEHDEFPKKPDKEETKSVTLNSDVIARAISKTLFATGTDELRPVMSGVFCELTSEGVTFVATDAHKLVKYGRKDVSAEESISFILPRKPLNQLKNILASGDFPVTMEYKDSNAFFSFLNYNMACRLIDGKYPNYNAVIPTNNPNVLVVDRISFLSALRRVSIFANQSTHQVRLKIAGQELVLSAEDVDFNNEAKERLQCAFQGEDMEIGFNSRFLLEMLNNLETDEVRLEMSAPNRAGILYPGDNENTQEDILMLVMPVMLGY
ncbi:MAG: DNA polymerase III subunit beta [Bacteroidetes bacterium]|nr:MAG: DNA polymerase III subunit beta [Bacteroidota bacterium]PIE87709.1 MAG: DNA polymerase III subunit beta [Bacteroidota bacterium]